MQGDRALQVQVPPAGPQHVGPLERPEVGVGRRIKQPVDQAGALVGGRVGEEGPCLVRCRQSAANVEVDPADELGVVGQRSRRDAALGERAGQGVVDAGGQRVGGERRLRPGKRGQAAFNLIPIVPIKPARGMPASSELLSNQKRLPAAECRLP